ncbi:MAG TPA: hypothetical protein PLE19_21410 [Planctomycetota bacterium]|nr:hypothetical protein [Planctomycetota bacterium]HRR82194.1 hypothetical protein [Planctomycetota bacterium]HRT97212.1 hypothetical protein [Planctomycetota bacterium]
MPHLRYGCMFLAALGLCAVGGEGPRAGEAEREALVRELIARSRLLEDAHFRVARPVWEQYVRETVEPPRRVPPVPVIAVEGVYALTVPADRKPLLEVTLRLQVLDAERCSNVPALTSALAWDEVLVGGRPATLATQGAWLCYTPAQAGEHVVSARIALRESTASGRSLTLSIPRSVATRVRFESPDPWELTVAPDSGEAQGQSRNAAAGERIPLTLRGEAGRGTHGQLALTPRSRLSLAYGPPLPVTDRPPRYALKGNVAWNLDAAVQQVVADLDVAIIGGVSDRLELSLPPAAERLAITGPDVRETQVAGGRAVVFLRGKVRERTRLRVACEMALAKEATQRLGELAITDGHWAGGTLVVTSTAGATEVLAGTLSGLRQIALGDIPASARALLAGAPAIACQITARAWSAQAELLNLGEFALQESIADLAHYELTFRPDGALVCRASYELRNRTRQFLRLELPPGALVLQARVNEESKALTAAPDAPNTYLVPLVRSLASVKGLVTFPVDVVFLCRLDVVGGTSPSRGTRREDTPPTMPRRGEIALPLPRIDVPIAYAWCETYLPETMRVKRWAGPLRQVEKYSNETATASLDYGLGVAAEGYRPKARPVPAATEDHEVAIEDIPVSPEPEEKPEEPGRRRSRLALLGFLGSGLGGKRETAAPKPAPPAKEPVSEAPPANQPFAPPQGQAPPQAQEMPATINAPVKALLWKNYYRSGRDFYDRQDYANARKSLEQVLALNPKSFEAENARKLLENIKLTTGEGKAADGPKSQAEKAAGLQVKREIQAEQRGLVEEQREYLEKGLAASRSGNLQDAKANLEAAAALGQQLVEQGASESEQDARLRLAREELSRIRAGEVQEVQKSLKKVQELKGKGRYDEALREAKQIQQQTDLGGVALQREITSLALEAVKQKAEELDGRRLRGREQPDGLTKTVEDRAVRLTPPPKPEPPGPGRSTTPETPSRRPDKPAVRAYDVSDLTLDINKLRSRQQALAADAGYSTRGGGGQEMAQEFFGGDEEDKGEPLTGEKLVDFIKKSIAPGTWETEGEKKPQDVDGDDYAVTYRNGRIEVRHTPEGHKRIEALVSELRRARGAQVEWGRRIATQQARGLGKKPLEEQFFGGDDETDELLRDRRFQTFVTRNYGWALTSPRGETAVEDSGVVRSGGAALFDDFAEKLAINRAQKVQVNGINLNCTPDEANGLGISFTVGSNGVSFAVVDEAQLRTLLELDAAKKRGRVAANPNAQETIVGTDAWLPNGMTCNVRFAGEVGNTLDVNGNPIDLLHQQYLVINNGGYLTAVQANPMQHWTEPRNPFPFVVTAQEIAVPRAGRLVKFEKTLVEPGDELVLRASYRYSR